MRIHAIRRKKESGEKLYAGVRKLPTEKKLPICVFYKITGAPR